MKFATIDSSQAPVYTFEIQPIAPTVEQVHEHIRELNTTLASINKGVFIIDITNMKFLSSENRIILGKWLKETTPVLKAKLNGMGFVAPLIQRMLLKGVFLVSAPPVEHSVFNNREEATAWAKARLA